MDFVDRFPLYPLIVSFVLFPLLAAPVLRIRPPKLRMRVFALLNVLGLAILCVISGAKTIRAKAVIPYCRLALLFFAGYFTLVSLHYLVVRLSKRNGPVWVPVAFFSPIAAMIYVKYLANHINPFGDLLATVGLRHLGVFFIGISYLSFRLIHLVQEVRNDVIEMPTFSEYISFAFYIPTLSIGPINPYSTFIRSIRNPNREKTPLERSLLRVIIGFTKYIFLGSLIAQFTYAGLLLDGHPHGIIDLFIAVPAYALYLYCNFSGFCDVVIGVSGLLNIEVAENFNRPFAARNFQEFWSRWHITLSSWIRDLVFTPLTKILMRRFGSRHANHVIAASLMIAFVLVGIWHGNGLNFLVFGALQGLGLVTVHYYTILLKKRLGKERFSAYRRNRLIAGVSTAMTFLYFSATLFFFANTWEQMAAIRHALNQ